MTTVGAGPGGDMDREEGEGQVNVGVTCREGETLLLVVEGLPGMGGIPTLFGGVGEVVVLLLAGTVVVGEAEGS